MINEKEKPYSFWPSEAVQHGLEKAVILYNLRFWLTVNKAAGKEKHYHDGKWWTYNTAKALENLMPFFNRRSISRWLSELERDGVLLSGVFNKVAYDRTKWYTIPSEFSDGAIGQNDQSIGQDDQSNGHDDQWNGQDGQPIPDCNPVSNTVDNLTPPTGSTAPEGDDSVCSLCLGYQWRHGNQCERCKGKGKESTVKESLTVEQPPKADKPKPKRNPKWQVLKNEIQANWPLIASADDYILTEWCKLRIRKGAKGSDIAHRAIEREINTLMQYGLTVSQILETAIIREWRGVEASWFNCVKDAQRTGTINAQPEEHWAEALRRGDYL